MSSAIQRFFGKKTPDELVKKWRQEIRAQQRGIDRQIRSIDTEEAKVKRSIKQVAKKGDTKSCKLLAKELIRSQKHKNRLYTSKAQMNSIIMQLEHQLATLKVAGTLQKSSEVMKLVSQLSKLPEVSKTMQQMSMEMTKAGLLEEMIGDTIDMMDDEDIEEAADQEVDNVLYQITDGLLGEAGSVGPAIVPNTGVPQQVEEEEEEEEEPELDMMQKRLQVLYTQLYIWCVALICSCKLLFLGAEGLKIINNVLMKFFVLSLESCSNLENCNSQTLPNKFKYTHQRLYVSESCSQLIL
ncbi:Snf7-domain-containing protein [Mycotypha africana]|uniref:Snf7-domain-containing protein n=1 Tax=Mycotypha africana TaxID=64632 RepID=UPI0023009449|nr:Snf7-domain-containing protein [Mycotypha africana]KAI8975601.1 Snf7-domain-containing protein [Mycotypha africana]